MSLTEEIFAHLSSKGTCSTLTVSVVLTAMLLSSGAPNASAFAIPPQKPYYKAIEASGSSFPICRITAGDIAGKRRYRPRTALGGRLMAIREQAIAEGLTLLNADEIVEEIRRRRGEVA